MECNGLREAGSGSGDGKRRVVVAGSNSSGDSGDDGEGSGLLS